MQTKMLIMTDIRGQQQEVEEKVEAAAKILREGGLVALPTETVYGLGANGLDAAAVRRIFEAKGRPQDNPLILHIPGAQWLARYCDPVPPIAYALAKRFWPGPLTMILPRRKAVPDETCAGLPTVGIRCPNHPVTLAIIRAAGVPIAAPSANTSGRPSCTTAADVLEDMDGKIDAIVDGGPCTVGVESTILDLTCDPPRLLRPGGLPLEALENVVGHIEVDRAVTALLKDGEKPKAPGMKYRHYAPAAPLTVVTGTPGKSAEVIAQTMGANSGVICFDEFAHFFAGHEVHTLGSYTDKNTQAQRVFDAMRSFDGTEVSEIFAQCPDNRGLGLAIGNRLKKAAGFHVVDADEQAIVIGITGGTGAGKTCALRAIERLGGKILDCDALYHELLETDCALRSALGAAFPEAFDEAGVLNRKKLGTMVFADSNQLQKLNEIIFRLMPPELSRRMAQIPASLYALDAINLIESGVSGLCDCTVAVTAPMELRVRRVMERDKISEEYARLRVAAQQPEKFYRENCDVVLENTVATSEKFEAIAMACFEKIIEGIKEEKQNGR